MPAIILVVSLALSAQAPADSPSKDRAFPQSMSSCVAVFPAAPTLSVRRMFSGRRVDLNVETFRAGAALFWLAEGRKADPRADDARTLDLARDDVLTALGGTLREERAVERGGRPGRELIVDLPARGRLGRRTALARLEVGRGASAGWFFEVVAVQPAGPAARPKDAERFLASFAPREGNNIPPPLGVSGVTGPPR